MRGDDVEALAADRASSQDRLAVLGALVDGRRQRRVDPHRLRPAIGLAEVVGDARLDAVGARTRERVREPALVGVRLDRAVVEVST